MAKINPDAKTQPQTSMETELWYADDAQGTNLKQIFKVQEIPTLSSAQEPQTYGCLESDEEYATKGTRKYESIEVPILFIEEQHDALKAIAESNKEVQWFVKLPDSTAAVDGKPLTYTWKGSLGLGNDTIALDGVLQEKMTIYKSTPVEEIKGLPMPPTPGA